VAGCTHALDDPARDEPRSGFLVALPRVARARLLAESIRISVPAGVLLYRDDERPRVLIVLSGSLRVFLSSVDGRQLTVRYARRGDVVGLALAVGGPGPTSVESRTAATVLAVGVDALRTLIAIDPKVARACAEELTRQLYRALDELSEQAFLPVRQRLVRQLLDLAMPDERGLVVRASHGELADAVGSVRVVVTRVLHRLRDEGLVEINRNGIVLRDRRRLASEASPAAERG
jgi:CRP/FNR family transcriptional regulator, cyclic AMP receptor protein